MSEELIEYTAAKRAIAQAREALDRVTQFDEVQKIESTAETWEALGKACLKQANDPELIEQAIELRFWAQVKAGEFLLKMKKHPGSTPLTEAKVNQIRELKAQGLPIKQIAKTVGVGIGSVYEFTNGQGHEPQLNPPKLPELGVTKYQASDWQKLARLSTEGRHTALQQKKDKAVGRAVKTKMKNLNPKPRPAPHADKMAAVGQIYAEGGKTRQQVAAEFGVGANTVTRAGEQFEAYQRGLEDGSVNPKDLSLSAQQKIDIAIRREKDKLRAQFDERVKAEIKQRIDELVLPSMKKRDEQYRLVVKSRKGIMSRGEFRLIASALHPDQSASKERLQQAFQTFLKYQLVLCAEPEIPAEPCPSPPRNFEEMMKARHAAQATRKSKNSVQRG